MSLRSSPIFIVILLLLYLTGCGATATKSSSTSNTVKTSISAKDFIANYSALDRAGFGSPVAYAVSMNKPTLLKRLLDSGENIEAPDPMGLTPLGLAITEKKPQMVALLLKRGANISADVPPHGQPLVATIEVNSVEVVRILLENGVDKNNARFHWRRPLDIAREKGNAAIIALLEKKNAPSADDDFKRENENR